MLTLLFSYVTMIFFFLETNSVFLIYFEGRLLFYCTLTLQNFIVHKNFLWKMPNQVWIMDVVRRRWIKYPIISYLICIFINKLFTKEILLLILSFHLNFSNEAYLNWNSYDISLKDRILQQSLWKHSALCFLNFTVVFGTSCYL